MPIMFTQQGQNAKEQVLKYRMKEKGLNQGDDANYVHITRSNAREQVLKVQSVKRRD